MFVYGNNQTTCIPLIKVVGDFYAHWEIHPLKGSIWIEYLFFYTLMPSVVVFIQGMCKYLTYCLRFFKKYPLSQFSLSILELVPLH